MLTYMSSPRNHMPHSSSPLNPQRSSSPPPLSSPTPVKSSLPRFNLPSISTPTRQLTFSSSPTRSPFSPRYQRTLPSSSISARRPRAASSSSASDVFGEGATPTQNAMWRDRLQRRMADRERRKNARASDLTRRRGMEDYTDDDEAERQAQADDEELFRRLMVLQRRREQHNLARYDGETIEFWADELDVLAEEEKAICDKLDQMDTDDKPLTVQEMWAREAAEAEAEEAEMAEAAMNCYDGGIETAHGYGMAHWEEMELGPEDWAKLAAVEAAMEDEAMDIEQ